MQITLGRGKVAGTDAFLFIAATTSLIISPSITSSIFGIMVHVDVKSVILGGRTTRATSVAASTVSDDLSSSLRF